jgi:hypothetical protein
MRWSLTLFVALIRQTLPATGPALLASAGLLAFWAEPLTEVGAAPYLLILAHSLGISLLLGRNRSGWFAFLHTRGFSRGALAAHWALAALASALVVWIPAAGFVATPLRGRFLDSVLQSPYGPFVYPVECRLPLGWLGGYFLFLGLFQLAWVRRAQPARGSFNGHVLAVAAICTWFHCFERTRYPSGWMPWILWCTAILCGGIALAAAIRVFGRVEVRA